jgi:hypothetical protein
MRVCMCKTVYTHLHKSICTIHTCIHTYTAQKYILCTSICKYIQTAAQTHRYFHLYASEHTYIHINRHSTSCLDKLSERYFFRQEDLRARQRVRVRGHSGKCGEMYAYVHACICVWHCAMSEPWRQMMTAGPYMYVCVRLHTCYASCIIFEWERRYTQTQEHIEAQNHTCTGLVHVYICVCMYIYMYTRMYILYTYINTYTNTHIYCTDSPRRDII